MPNDLAELVVREWMGQLDDERQLSDRLRSAVAAVVAKQAALGVDIVSDGEFSKSSWMGYAVERLEGVEVRIGTGWYDDDGAITKNQDYIDFPDFFREARDQMTWFAPGAETRGREWAMARESIVSGPLRYSGHHAISRDIANLTAAAKASGVEEAFLPVAAPASVESALRDEHYRDEEAFFADLAAALRVEYAAIIDAGLICQIDDAWLAGAWEFRRARRWDRAAYRRWVAMSVDALNEALDGLPEDRIRYHVCWGSSNRPHGSDIELREILDQILRVNAQTYVLEAANARHEWEWRVWEDVALPEGKILMPGVIEHATHVVEHPETVAERIIRFANVVGRENVIAGTDCGFRGRSHPDVAWAKLRALTQGAEVASDRLWNRPRARERARPIVGREDRTTSAPATPSQSEERQL
jgi:5-methyltetrahydropteroyltriglutamate--homocysteine methyltransferase